MWICSKLGFFSIVRKEGADGDEASWHVRARVRGDLDNLRVAADIAAEVSESETADYRYRLVVGKEGFVEVMATLAGSVDYPNFKSEIGGRADQAPKLEIYEAWWLDMLAIQPAGGVRFFGRGPALLDDDEGVPETGTFDGHRFLAGESDEEFHHGDAGLDDNVFDTELERGEREPGRRPDEGSSRSPA